MTTAIDAAFRARLEPAYSIDQFDQRADSAARICHEAIAVGDADRASLAFTRLVSRWARRDGMQEPDSAMWRRRHGQVEAIVTALPDGSALLDDAWWQWYRTLRRVDGASEAEAGRFATERLANQKALAEA